MTSVEEAAAADGCLRKRDNAGNPPPEPTALIDKHSVANRNTDESDVVQ